SRMFSRISTVSQGHKKQNAFVAYSSIWAGSRVATKMAKIDSAMNPRVPSGAGLGENLHTLRLPIRYSLTAPVRSESTSFIHEDSRCRCRFLQILNLYFPVTIDVMRPVDCHRVWALLVSV